MLKIGDFARLGLVSVRMLRHYDSLGLLVPAHVDEWSGYRTYTADQLARLNRLVALKDLGFTLEQVRDLLDRDNPEHLLAMLRLRHDQLAEELDHAHQRLADVERRLRLIEREGNMSDYEFITKPLPALRLAQLTAHVDSQPEIAAAIGPLCGRLAEALLRRGAPLGPSLGVYSGGAETGLTVHAAWEYAGEECPDFEVVTLEAEPAAVTTTYVGPVTGMAAPWQALAQWCQEQNLELSGPCREVYLETPADQDAAGRWVVELQQPVRRG